MLKVKKWWMLSAFLVLLMAFLAGCGTAQQDSETKEKSNGTTQQENTEGTSFPSHSRRRNRKRSSH